ncbi:MAG: biopolymer transporter ExbD [Deltaproteobacteria bacterium]|nr:biopolymer transporter ExbD [Deltaproteobacteria bacterium]
MTSKWVGKGYRARPVMNVTPLVDVVLVLLIIFMVVIPAIEQGMAIEVPGIHNPDKKARSDFQAFTVTVTKEGTVWLDDQEIPWGKLEARLKVAAFRAPGKRVVLRGDKGASYGNIRRAYRVAQQVGFPGIAMKVSHRRDQGSAQPGR